jgi:predicted ATP-grasp superfamily ATP-dependent carboligase
MYTGGLENHPALVDRIAAQRPLLGNSGAVLRAVRDPLRVAAELREAGLPHLEVGLSPLAEKPCLRKPKHSCGGMRIEFARNASAAEPGGAWYFQEYVAGEPAAAIYVAGNSRALLVGVTRQLVGESWTGALPFRYCGSLGPLSLAPERRAKYERLGACLAERFPLSGLFGVDVIENEAGIWPVEVNPRYTASVEILERASALSAVELHAAACRGNAIPLRVNSSAAGCFGKAVLFAQAEIFIGRELTDLVTCMNGRHAWPAIADVPQVGTQIHAGQPIVSVFASGRENTHVMAELKRLASCLHTRGEPS